MRVRTSSAGCHTSTEYCITQPTNIICQGSHWPLQVDDVVLGPRPGRRWPEHGQIWSGGSIPDNEEDDDELDLRRARAVETLRAQSRANTRHAMPSLIRDFLGAVRPLAVSRQRGVERRTARFNAAAAAVQRWRRSSARQPSRAMAGAVVRQELLGRVMLLPSCGE